ncbi:hypothetical protein D3C72_1420780 [compost metagenome]
MQAAIGAPFQNARHGQAGVGAAVVGLAFELQVGHRQVNLHQVTVGAVRVLDFQGLGAVTEVGGVIGPAYFTATFGAQRQAQVDLAVFRAVVFDFQRWRWWQVCRDIEHRAVRHDAPCTGDGDLAQAQILVVQLQLAEAIEGCIQAAKTLMQGRFGGTSSLLEMLWFDEQAFRPQDRVT